MHKVEIGAAVRERILQRRLSLHPFGTLEAKRTAHVVVDLQNGFMAPGAVSEIAAAREIVPNVNRISRALRANGGLVVYIQNTFDQTAVAGWSTFFEHFCSPERRARMIEAFTPGDPQHAIWPGLEVEAEDLLVRKRRFGAFVEGSSDLHAILQARGIDTLIVTGTATNVCCESTARDAMMLNYRVFFVSDGNATHTDAEHNATLTAMANIFADVSSTDEVVALIEGRGAIAQAAE
ncbi:isochorismatase family cysteine hydrolase [Roseomonas sp. E05]|uniref:isochorismatase family protein n=1 Tax=Roseomonas sp. E05 TaxID=3046310 RepID=UPI0024BB1F47|nr:isochorismatase family cysteine hydrolase [Roseomonas sp. E05]MDJ0390464.1 isochorismatase family cysteine hydrolase [Roseomonas sp. E05]